MGLRNDLDRFREVGEERRQDISEFIQTGDMSPSGDSSIRIPVKIVDLPEFVYDDRDGGGVGQADSEPDVGDPVDAEPDGGDADDGDGEDDAGDGDGEHGYYEMDPSEFADALDEELDLNLEPKGKRVVEEKEGDFTDVARSGPNSTLRVDDLFRRGLKRKMAFSFDENYVQELLCVADLGPSDAFSYLRAEREPVSLTYLRQQYQELDADERSKWPDTETFESCVEKQSTAEQLRTSGIDTLPFRREDRRYRHPEVVEEKQQNVVIVNIRDVSGSMQQAKRELVERTFAPIDWYLQGTYDNAEFVYIAHDTNAWEVERESFFGIESSGGTRISSAYELAQEILSEQYPFSKWNRFVLAAGDGENKNDDTTERVIPLMKEIGANLHGYVQVQPDSRYTKRWQRTHAYRVASKTGDSDNIITARVAEPGDVPEAIQTLLGGETE